jgi:hypothetical protein
LLSLSFFFLEDFTAFAAFAEAPAGFALAFVAGLAVCLTGAFGAGLTTGAA